MREVHHAPSMNAQEVSGIESLLQPVQRNVHEVTAGGRVQHHVVAVSLTPVLPSVVLWFAVALTVSALACAAPARRATRISARDALAHE